MSIIKQLATYDGSAWTKDDIGANASNVSLNSNIAGSNNVQGALSNLCGASKLTGSSAIVTNSSGILTASAVTSTELGYLDGVTSNLQGQIDTLNNNFNNNFGEWDYDEVGVTGKYHSITTSNVDLTKTDNNLTNSRDYQNFISYDKNKKIIGAFETFADPNGDTATTMYIINYDTAGERVTTAYPQLRLTQTKSGERSFDLWDCDNIRFNSHWMYSIVPVTGSSVSLKSGSTFSLTAPNRDGYTFIYWLGCSFDGWAGIASPSYPTAQTTNWYMIKFSSSEDSTAHTVTPRAYALYIQNGLAFKS